MRRRPTNRNNSPRQRRGESRLPFFEPWEFICAGGGGFAAILTKSGKGLDLGRREYHVQGMAQKTRCHVHGVQEATYVCRHILGSLDTGEAVGFHWPASSTSPRPDAWCSECERVRIVEGGEWTEWAMEFVQLKVICAECYDRAKSIWQAAADTKAQ